MRRLKDRDLRRFVGAAAVNDDTVVAERQCVETARDVAGLIQGNNDGALLTANGVPLIRS